MRPYEDLRAWQLAHELVLAVYRSTGTWPSAERYALSSQARRAAFSVAANIVEGAAKGGQKEFRRFLDMSIGSISELRYVLRLAYDLGYLSNTEFIGLDSKRDRTARVLWGLYRAVKATVRSSS